MVSKKEKDAIFPAHCLNRCRQKDGDVVNLSCFVFVCDGNELIEDSKLYEARVEPKCLSLIQ